MQRTVEGYYKTLPYHLATAAEARASWPAPPDEEAHEDLVDILGYCTPTEIEALLDRALANTIDGMYVETCVFGILASLRGISPWPMTTGVWRDWEELLIYPGGPLDKRWLLLSWLVEAWAAAREREAPPL
jgi:hypothetical protein